MILSVYNTEPVGSVSPKISGDEIKLVRVRINEHTTLFCPAQAYPVAIYR